MKKRLFIIPLLFTLCSCSGSNSSLNAFIKQFKKRHGENFIFPAGTYFYKSSQLKKRIYKDRHDEEIIFKEEVSAFIDLNCLPTNDMVLFYADVNSIDYHRKTYYESYENYVDSNEEFFIKYKNNEANFIGALTEKNNSSSLEAYLPNCSFAQFRIWVKNTLALKYIDFVKPTSWDYDEYEKKKYDRYTIFYNNILNVRTYDYTSNINFDRTIEKVYSYQFDDLEALCYFDNTHHTFAFNNSNLIIYEESSLYLAKLNDEIDITIDNTLPRATYDEDIFPYNLVFPSYESHIVFED